MTPTTITALLVALAALVVLLTRLRIGREGAAGQVTVPRSVAWAHTVAGLLAVVCWVAMLATGDATWGWIGLPLWWLTVLAGLVILLRWMPARGRHASDPVADAWGEGPGLSILAHGGLLVGVVVLTAFLVLDKVP